jgi:hypothetical protein
MVRVWLGCVLYTAPGALAAVKGGGGGAGRRLPSSSAPARHSSDPMVEGARGGGGKEIEAEVAGGGDGKEIETEVRRSTCHRAPVALRSADGGPRQRPRRQRRRGGGRSRKVADFAVDCKRAPPRSRTRRRRRPRLWDSQRLGRGTSQISRECGSVGRSPQNAAGVASTAGGATVRPPFAFCTCEAGSGSRWRQSYASILFIRDIMHLVRTGSITSIDVRIYSVVYRSTEFGFQNHSTVRPNPTSRGQIRWAENSSLCVWPFSGWRGSASCSSQIWAERTQICLSCW